jgi:hypothetical protein
MSSAVEQSGERVGLCGWCRVRRHARAEIAESRRTDDSTVRKQVADGKESPDAVVEDPMHNEHWVAVAPLGVFDRTPSRRDCVAFHCGQARARSVQIPPVKPGQAECGDRHTRSKCPEE